jgi:tetratricopeptide (TPR) repeat protein
MSSYAAIVGLAGQNIAEGRPLDALKLLDAALDEQPAERTLLALKAQAHHSAGQPIQAAASLAAMIATTPSDAECLTGLGLILDGANRTKSAEQAFIAAQRIRPDFTRPILAQAHIRICAGDFARGFELIKQAGIGAPTPERVDMEQRLRHALVRAYPLSARALWRLINAGPYGHTPLGRHVLIDLNLQIGAFQAAEDNISRLERMRSDWPGLDSRRCIARFGLGDWEGAAACVQGDPILVAAAKARWGQAEPQDRDLIEKSLAITDNSLADIDIFKHWADLDHPAYRIFSNKAELQRAIIDLTLSGGGDAFVAYPESYLLPEEARDLQAAQPGIWMAKPIRTGLTTALACYAGGGPALSALMPPDVLVQRLVDQPFLVHGRKAALGLVLVLSAPDLTHALIFDDGFAEFAPAPAGSQRMSPLDHSASAHKIETDLDRIITTPERWRDHPGHDAMADDGEPWAAIWSLRCYISELSRQRGIRGAGIAWNNLVKLARDCARLVDHCGILQAQTETLAPWSFPPKILRIDCLLDEELKAHFLGIGPIQVTPEGNPAIAGVTARLTKALSELQHTPADVIPSALTQLFPPSPLLRRETAIDRPEPVV